MKYTPAGGEDILEAVTFSHTIGKLVENLEGGEAIALTLKTGDKGDLIDTLEVQGESQTQDLL